MNTAFLGARTIGRLRTAPTGRISAARMAPGGLMDISGHRASRLIPPPAMKSRTFFSNSKSSPSTEATNKRARVAVVGSGRMGAIRSALVQANPHLDFVGVIDTQAASAQVLADQYGVGAFATLDDALDAARNTGHHAPLDGLLIASPTHTHSLVIQEAANSGLRGVFCEKPVGVDAPEIAALFGMASVANMHLCCGFQRRFDPSYVATAEALHAGAVGTPVVANIFFADHPAPPKEFMLNGGGGDIFLDLCAHDVDFITHALNDTVHSVYATGITSSDPELQAAGIQDNAVMVMHMKRTRAVVTLFMSRSAAYGYDQRCEVFGDKGLVSLQNPHETSMVISTVSGVQQSRLHHSFPQRFERAFALEIDAFADVLLEKEDAEWPITEEQCIKVQKVADAARQSCDEMRLVEIDYDA